MFLHDGIWMTSQQTVLQISGITEPWLYIGPGFAGMHQEDGMMTSINVSVPVTFLPMTDGILMDSGVDFMKATKVRRTSSWSAHKDLIRCSCFTRLTRLSLAGMAVQPCIH